MNTRKIKDGKVDGEKIYFKSHAKATYMSDGRTVEDAVNSINTGDLSQYATKTDLQNIENQIAAKGIYSKPSTGIPKSDLASAVQTSLNKADTALQSHQDISGKQDKLVSGTNIKTINGTSILGSGNIVIEGGVTEEYVNHAISSAITTTLNTLV